MVSMIVFLNFLIHKLEESGDRYFLLSRGVCYERPLA